MNNKLKVIDLFCGAGGFSEGLRQAGFDIIWAVDNWQVAVDTHKENHPSCITIKDDIIRLSKLPDKEFHKIIPDSEIIIGSPPCTAFSNSNRSGKGDKAKGIILIESYLRIVARKKFKRSSILKYWILENVPKVQNYLKEEYHAKDLEIEGNFKLIVKRNNSGIYNAKYYGVPSNRIRYFCGEFPLPKQVFKDDNLLIPLKTILSALGAPKEKLHTEINDPIYLLNMKGEDVTDHHYIKELAEFEWKKAKKLKQDKGYMGKMSLPENEERPARTIMAMLSFSARESFILGNGKNKYRAPAIREVASMMSFPIDYRFYGTSHGLKYKLVGNAVPPKMGYAFACSILIKEKRKPNKNYIPINHSNKVDLVNLNLNIFHINTEKPKRDTAGYKYHIPYFIFNTYRVELTNYHSDFKNLRFKWDVEIHYNQGPRAKVYIPKLESINYDKEEITVANKFFYSVNGQLKDFNSFQKVHCMTNYERKTKGLIGPDELLNKIREFLDKEFNFNKVKEYTVLVEEPGILPKPIALGYYLLL
jgi:DNA (cytosine-5)-methyltransferase 1